MEGFERHMAEQRERARAGATFGADRTKIPAVREPRVGGVKFLGYESLVSHTVAVGMLSGGEVVGEVTEGDEVEIALVETPFYPEGGGQVGDAGEIVGPEGKIIVHDTQRVMPDLIMHFGKVVQGKIALGQPIDAYVDPVRERIPRGTIPPRICFHAPCARLRFDFSHVEPVTPEEMRQIQFLVNEKIRHNATVMKSEDRYSNAIERGALAFFGDKYEDTVRLIEIANGATFSFEVCGVRT
ncbi:Alanine--tRNA ligase [Geodia barretti]|uniref:Alanine--tRNA ligase n=1 Tax=Geodia barretti TaxID=519541 RepID=A0AA35RQ06_GEOBA|nr:Alanine--tRNA ligase [Geodia barretti]